MVKYAGVLVGFPFPDALVRAAILLGIAALAAGAVQLYRFARRGQTLRGLKAHALCGLIAFAVVAVFFRVRPAEPLDRLASAVLNVLVLQLLEAWLMVAAVALSLAWVRRWNADRDSKRPRLM